MASEPTSGASGEIDAKLSAASLDLNASGTSFDKNDVPFLTRSLPFFIASKAATRPQDPRITKKG